MRRKIEITICNLFTTAVEQTFEPRIRRARSASQPSSNDPHQRVVSEKRGPHFPTSPMSPWRLRPQRMCLPRYLQQACCRIFYPGRGALKQTNIRCKKEPESCAAYLYPYFSQLTSDPVIKYNKCYMGATRVLAILGSFTLNSLTLASHLSE